MTHFASLYPAPVAGYGVLRRAFALAVLELARVPTYALLEVAQAGRPHVLHVGAVGYTHGELVGDVVVDVVGGGGESL